MVRIVCEGSGDRKLLKLLLTHLKIDFTDDNFERMSGKSYLLDNTNKKYKMLKQQVEIQKISKLLFVLDSDYIENDKLYGGYENSERSVQKLIADLSLESISDFFISCNPDTKEGYIESLVLTTIPREHRECIETFLNCSEPRDRKEDKFIVQTVYEKYYPNSGYNFEHENFKPLIDKLRKLFGEE